MKCQYFDLLAYEPKILFKSKQSMASIYGVFLTLLSFSTIIGISLYFFISMLSNSQYTVVVSSGKSLNNTMPLSGLPVMVRVANYSLNKIDEQIATVIFRHNYGQVDVPMPYRCDINKHFAEEWRDLVKDIDELDSYNCFDPADPAMFNVSYTEEFWIDGVECRNTKTTNCGGNTNDQVNKILETTYLQFITIDFIIDNDDPDNPFKPYLFYKRFPISSTFYKQYFLNRKIVEYRSERGLVFSDVKITKQPVYDFVEWSGDLRPNARYGQVVLRMSDTYEVRTRNIFKLQNVLANVGGISKFFLTIFSFISLVINENFYYYHLAQYFFQFDADKKKRINTVAKQNTPNIKDESCTGKFDLSNTPKDLKVVRVNNYTAKTTARRANMTFMRRLCPSKDQRNVIDFVKERMSVESIMGLYNEFEKIKLYIFSDKELEAFNGLGNFNFVKYEEKRRRSSVLHKDMSEFKNNDSNFGEKFQKIKSIID
jgi:hypothetical protein